MSQIKDYMKLRYPILLHQEDDSGQTYWIAEIPALPGCKSHGATVGEAMRNVEDAKRVWVQDNLEHGEEVPMPAKRG